jgi:amidase
MLAYDTATALSAALRRREIGAEELLDEFLARLRRFNPRLNAIVETDLDGARVQARAADAALAKGIVWGPLHGLPMTVKESFDIAGFRTTCGVPAWAANRPAQDADAVARLRTAGAVIFGKTNVPAMTADMQSYNDVYGTTNNPWDPARAPGGSSGGSAAALAAGLTPLELGSDIGGSIRNPAHYCGVFGHKPSYGIVPIRGHVPPPDGALSAPDIGVAGPLARSAEDLDLALGLLAGPDEDAATAWSLNLPQPRGERLVDFRVGVWLDDARAPLASDVRDCLEATIAAAERAGLKADRKARPAIDSRTAWETFITLLSGAMSPGHDDATIAGWSEAAAKLAGDDRSHRALVLRGGTQRHRDWLKANEQRAQLRRQWAAFFRDYDAVLMPVMPTAALAHDHSTGRRSVSINGAPFNYWEQIFWAGIVGVVYLPATVMPAGRTPAGLPVGLQIVGPHLEDRTPIRLAGLIAQAAGGFVPPPGYA